MNDRPGTREVMGVMHQEASWDSNVEAVSEELETGAPGRINCMCKGPGHLETRVAATSVMGEDTLS